MAAEVVITVYRDKSRLVRKWRWRLRHGNEQNFAASGESFASRRNALRAAYSLAELIITSHTVQVVVDDG